MLNTNQKEFLTKPISLWLSTANIERVPDLVRCTGIVVENETTIQCFFPEKFSARCRENISARSMVSLYCTCPTTLAGYQYKGQALKVMPCTEGEIEIQRRMCDAFVDILLKFGLAKEPMFNLYFGLPSYALRIKVEHVFDQMPKQNTGKEITHELTN